MLTIIATVGCQDEEGDAYEIHHSGEPQLQGLLTYGKDAQLIEPRTR